MPRQHNREIDVGGGQRNSLQLAWLFAANSSSVPEVHRLRNSYRSICHRRVAGCVDSNEHCGHENGAGSGDSSDHDFPPTQAVLLSEREKSGHACGAGCRVIDTWVGERYI